MTTTVEAPPPDISELLGGSGGGGWVVLIKARHDIDAHLLAGRLTEAGIESRSVKDVGAPGAWMYGGSNPWAPVSILVKKLDLDDARLVLAEISLEGPPAERNAARVSRHASFPVIWWVTALILGAALSTLVVGQVTRWSVSGCQLPALCEGR